MLQRVDYKTNLMIGDQTYPAFELRNVLEFIGSHLGRAALEDVCAHIGVGLTELEHCQFVFVWQVKYALEYLRLQSGEPDIGTQLGLSYTVASLDILLPHLAQLGTLQACLQFVVNHPQLVGSLTDSLIRLEDDCIAIRWLNTGRMAQAQYAFQFLHSIGSLLGLARQLTGQGVTLKHIHLADAPRDSQFLQQATGAEIVFNAAYFEWSIDLAYLGLPVTYAFEQVRHKVSEQGEISLIDTVLAELRGSLPEVPSLDALAARLHMSDRSLRRKLSNLGTSYQKLLDQVRCQNAIALILKDTMS
ncbi:MAG: AraC family transcriptional regulator ligand-binding domain-containing protein, partial [Shewanella sp.]